MELMPEPQKILMTRDQLMRQIRLARMLTREAAKHWPWAFDERGKPLVAELHLPRSQEKSWPH